MSPAVLCAWLAAPSRGPRASEALTADNRDLDDCGLWAAGSCRARHHSLTDGASPRPWLLDVRRACQAHTLGAPVAECQVRAA
jgi:hypothetical protein